MRPIANWTVFYKRRGQLVEPWREVDLSLKYAGADSLSTSSDLVKLGLAYLGGGYLANESHVATTPVPGDDGVVTTTAQRPKTASSG